MSAYHIIVNPVSGKGMGRLYSKRLTNKLHSYGKKFFEHICNNPDEATELTQKLMLHSDDYIIIIGGDGTIHEVINGVMSRQDGMKVPIGIVPAGTGNSLMHDLDCLNVAAAIDTILSGKTKPIDILEINNNEGTCYAFNVIGMGLVADINRKAEQLRRWGGLRYNLATLWSLFSAHSLDISLRLNDDIRSFNGHLVMVLNTAHTGNGLKMAPHARVDDGHMHVFITHDMSRQSLFWAFLRIFRGTHLDHPKIEYFDVHSMSIDYPEGHRLMIDGQDKGYSPVQVRIIPKALEIFCSE